MHRLKSLYQHPFIRGSFIFTSATFLVSVLSYIFNLFVARGMSLSEYGEYSSAVSYLSLLAVPFGTLNLIVIGKIGNIGLKDRILFISNLEYKFSKLVQKNLFISIIISLLMIGLMTIKGNLQFETSVFVILAVWSSLYFTFYSSALFALKEFWQSGVVQVIQGILKVLLGAMIIYFLPRLDLLYGSLLISTVLGVYLSRKALNLPKLSDLVSNPISQLNKILKNSEYYLPLVTSIGTIGMINIDLILVKKFFPADEVGFYAAISLLGKIILYIATPLTAVAYTFFTGKENIRQKNKIFLLTTASLIAMGLISILGYTTFSSLIVSIIFGNKFSSIQTALTLAAIFGSSYSVMTLFSQYLLSNHSKFAMFSIPAFLTQIFLIYRYHDNFSQILLINIICTISLFLIYALVWLHHSGVLYGKVGKIS